MRRRAALLFLLSLAMFAAPLAAQVPAPAPKLDVSGKWNIVLELSIGTSNPTLVLKPDGNKVTGTYTSSRYGDSKLTGTIDDKRVLTFTVALSAEGADVTMLFTGEVSADGQFVQKGVVNIEGLGEGSWAAKKDKS